MINRKNIWNYKQNKPTYIVDDLVNAVMAHFRTDMNPAGRARDMIYESLLKRGVFKWLSVRRQLIRLKNTWKSRLIEATVEQLKLSEGETTGKQRQRITYLRGYRKAIEECRKEIRTLCHSDRWQAPDFDYKASSWLFHKGNEENAPNRNV